MTPSRWLPLAAASAFAIFLYAALRGIQFVFIPEPNPATVIFSEHAGYFWRMLIAAYAGGMIGLLTILPARRDPARVARLLERGLYLGTAAIILQALLAP
jgi:hypothetical protein